MNTQTYKPITTEQINKITDLFQQTKYRATDMEGLVKLVTKIRTDNINFLTFEEAKMTIEMLLEDVEWKNKNSITTAQIKKIHVLLQQKGLMEEKETMVYSISGKRTTSTKELTLQEAKRLIDFLLNEAKEIENGKKRIYNVIWHIAWEMGIIYGNTDDDYQMNRAKLNMFCRQRGTVKKNLSEMNLIELKSTHRQFEAMFKKYSNSKKTTNK